MITISHPQGRRVKGKRSSFEAKIEEELQKLGVDYQYEGKSFRYYESHMYTPDFVLGNGICLEVKGWFTAADRQKALTVQKMYPELDIRFIFGKNNKMSKYSDSRYSDWCIAHGFKYAIGSVPPEWILEEPKEIPKSYKKSINRLIQEGKIE